MKKGRTFRVRELKKEVVLAFLIFSTLIVFCFAQEYQTKESEWVPPPNMFILLEVYLNGATKDNLTAVFYFNNTNTYETDNSTLNRDFLDYFTQRLETIRNQVSGILAFPLEYLGINWTETFPVFENTSNFDINFEQTNKSASLLLEEWYILNAEAAILIIDYKPPPPGEDPWYLRALKSPAFLASALVGLLILSLYLKKGKHHNQPRN